MTIETAVLGSMVNTVYNGRGKNMFMHFILVHPLPC